MNAANKESCVIVCRCANFILKENAIIEWRSTIILIRRMLINKLIKSINYVKIIINITPNQIGGMLKIMTL